MIVGILGVRLRVLLALFVAALVGAGLVSAPAQAASRGGARLSIATAAANPGTAVTLVVRTGTRAARPVVIQRKKGSRWRTVARIRSKATGRAALTVAFGARSSVYRAFVPATKVKGRRLPARTTGSARVGRRLGSGSDLVVRGVRSGVPSADGRFIAYTTEPDPIDDTSTVRLRDRATGEDRLVSPPTAGDPRRNSGAPRISDDGRYVVYLSFARAVVGDVDDEIDVYSWDRLTGATRLVSDLPGDSRFESAEISGDGQVVSFTDQGPRIRTDPAPYPQRTFLWSRATGLIEGLPQSAGVICPLSRDGRYVACRGQSGVTVLDRVTGTSTVGPPTTADFDISADGSSVVVEVDVPLTSVNTRGWPSIYLWNVRAGTYTLVSASASGGSPNSDSQHATISGDGRFVAYVSSASNLVPDDPDRVYDLLLWDRTTGRNTRISRRWDGADLPAMAFRSRMSNDGRHVVFEYGDEDLWVWDAS